MIDNYDFVDYVLHYDCLYNTNHIFAKDSFKQSDGCTVPIVHHLADKHGEFMPENCFGHAVIENRDDGVVAKCTFSNHDYGRTAEYMIAHTKEYGLSVYANGIQYDDLQQPAMTKKILSANVMCVIALPIASKPRVKEETNV